MVCLDTLQMLPDQASGIYLSRSLSYEGAEFSIINVDIDPAFKVHTTLCAFLQVSLNGVQCLKLTASLFLLQAPNLWLLQAAVSLLERRMHHAADDVKSPATTVSLQTCMPVLQQEGG